MRLLMWIAGLSLVAACAGKSNEARSADTGNLGGAGTSTALGSGGSGAIAHDAGALGPSAIGTGGQGRAATGVTGGDGGNGSAGASAMAGSGGPSERDAGQGAAGSGARDGGEGGAGGQAGTGESTGTGGSTSEGCSQLETDYSTALAAAQMCDARASAQCQHVVASRLGCYCMAHVNGVSSLNDIQAQYTQAGCPTSTCPGIFCVSPGTGTCTTIDRGDVCE